MNYKIGYARVSTRDQNLETQKQKLLDAGCDEVFADKGSGANTNRKGLQDALRYLRQGDELVVSRMDRLARNLKDLVDVMDRIANKQASLISLNEKYLSIDNSPQGKLMLHVIGAVAEFELSLIRSRTKEAQKVAKENGVRFGKPPKLTLKEQKEVYGRVSSNMLTMKDAAKIYGVSRPTIYRIVKKFENQGIISESKALL